MRGEDFRTFGGVLCRRAESHPDGLAYSFLGDGETETERLSFSELDARARAIAARLTQEGAFGRPVLLLYPPGLDYVAGFFGCLYAGAIAVPLYPPDPRRVSRTLPRLLAVVADAGAQLALTTDDIRTVLEGYVEQAPALRTLRCIATDRSLAPEPHFDPREEPEGLAYLQYTSGSTGNPKGVMVTHANLLENCADMSEVWRLDERSRMVSWLPLFHDMGLIAGMLLPLYLGNPTQLMSPLSFVANPVRWLRAIDRFGGTISGAPNFAYDLCVAKVREADRDTLDLSRWRTAFNAAEPVRASTIRKFTETFAWSGFRRDTFYPSYGLAEATLIVTAGKPGRVSRTLWVDAEALGQGRLAVTDPAAPGAKELASCGTVVPSQELAIVDPDTRTPCADGSIGEVWVRGRAVTRGYRQRPEENERTFLARTDAGEGPYLRTGDLGFRYEGELYLASRHKDLIIVRGRNHYPQDLERASENSDPMLRLGCAAAFATEDDARVIVLQEVREEGTEADYARAMRAIRMAIAEECDVRLAEVALVARGELFKTSSGKIQRRLCRSRYGEGGLRVLAVQSLDAAESTDDEPVAPPEPPASIEVRVRRVLGRALRTETSGLDTETPLVALGLDSLTSIEVCNALAADFGVRLEQVDLLDRMTLAGLIARITSGACAPAAPVTEVEPAAETDLSPGQSALWFLHQLEPESPSYNQIFAATVRSELDVRALRVALDRLVSRHAVLRTTYGEREGKPFQRVREQLPVAFTHVDGRTWDEARVEAKLAEETHRPFDLIDGPMLRVCVIERGEREWALLVAVHHIAMDFWSLGILVDEWGTCYRAAVEGCEPELGPIPASYPAYVHAAQAALEGPAGETHLAYWRDVLANRPPVLDLPAAARRPPVWTNRGAAHTFHVPAALADQLRALASAEGVTLYTALLAAFQTLLHRHGAAEDLVIGSPTAGRRDPAFADTLGYFVNLVPLRADLSGRPSFRELLARTKGTVLGALAHQDYPLSELVDRLGVERDASRSPLFDVVFLVQKPYRMPDSQMVRFALGEPGARLDVGGLMLESRRVAQNLARFDLELWIVEEADGLLGSIRYGTDLFDAATIARMSQHLVRLLEAAVREPERPVAALPMLTASEHAQMVTAWNETAHPYPEDRCLHELFEAAAAATPEATAVLFEKERLDYRELDAWANRIAHHLVAQGIGRGSHVAVVLERGLEMVPALLGILKAGGTYVPIEPSYPDVRIADTCRALDVAYVLTQREHGARLEALLGPRGILRLDDRAALAGCPTTNPGRPVHPEDRAYVILTSGSTGTPKGVVLQHRPVVNTIDWVNRRYGIGAHDRVLFLTSLCFDLSVYDVFGLLAAGGSIRIASARDVADPMRLLDWLCSGEITFWDSAPAALRQLVPFLEDGNSDARAWAESRLRLVFLSGDWIPITLPGQVAARFPQARVVGLGGATEAAIWSNFHDIERVDPSWPSIPYGRPIQNARYYVLDADRQPCPVGVPGELFIGGECLAMGYAGDPDLSAAKFVPDPYGRRPDAIMYRTGDRARFWADGTIEFLGRVDAMVKVRGYRVEPGEIETLLHQHPRVREAAVMARGERTDTKLVAYVTPASATTDASEPATARVGEWTKVFDDVYGSASNADDPSFNLAGWVDGHTGLPFPADEMREWVDTTVARILELSPQRVLEIGCGTGLLLARIAPHCRHYLGTDVSATALDHVRERILGAQPELAARVELQRIGADDIARLNALGDRTFDLIVINSVAQYFPSLDYLVGVLRAAVAMLAPGGAIFLGDIRNLALSEPLRLSVQLHRADDAMPVESLLRHAAAAEERERELLLHPSLFSELAVRLAGLGSARVLLKRGTSRNELTRFRVDAILSTREATQPIRWAWRGEALSDVAARIASERPAKVRITDLPDDRLATLNHARHVLQGERPPTVGTLRAAMAGAAGIDPEMACRLAEQLPGGAEAWSAEAHWPESGVAGHFDLVVTARRAAAGAPVEKRVGSDLDWYALANVPAHRQTDKLVAALREYLRERLPEYMVPSAFLVLPDGLPVTRNGKLDRQALPEPDDARATVDTEFVQATNPTQTLLAKIWSEVLGVAQVGVHDRFFELGGDSILGIQVVAKAARHGLRLVPRDLFQHQTIAELAAAADRARPHGEAHEMDAEEGELPLTPVQHWFFGLELAQPGHFNQSFVVEAAEDIPVDRLERAIHHVFDQHDALRMRYWRDHRGWHTRYDAHARPVIVDRAVEPADVRAAAAEYNSKLDVSDGPLARVVLFHSASGSCRRLLIVVHHLAIDGVSWWVLLDQLSAAVRGAEDAAPPASFRRWAKALARAAVLPEMAPQVSKWARLLSGPVDPLPGQHHRKTGTEALARTERRALGEAETESLLTRANTAYRTHTDEVLLTALLAAVHRWAGIRRVRVDLEGHGREMAASGMPDASRTVGWFTTITPLRFDLHDIDPSAEPGRALTALKEQRRAVPGGPADFGLLRYLDDASTRALGELPAADIGFNYLGQLDRVGGATFRLATEWAGPWRGPANHRPYPLEINGHVSHGRFEIAITHDPDRHDPSSVSALADAYVGALRALIAHCTSEGAGAFSPSDFPVAGLDQRRLDAVLGSFRRARQDKAPKQPVPSNPTGEP
ncbi:amino acid adenylation domain-containing protein [Pendulispora rubella]|uniref:Amino acid adenylation domain-containing protein n=1 Tax=Pendulispora rubella TaxID=2741070 RepID=A0ABZ2LDB5_9BACT